MNVLHIIHNLEREGAQVVLHNLTSSELSQSSHFVCAWKYGGGLVADFEKVGIPVFSPEKSYGLKNIVSLIKFISEIVKSNKVDLIHAHMSDAAFLGMPICMMHRLPLVITHHCDKLVPEANKVDEYVRHLFLRANAWYAKCNVAITPAIRHRITIELKLPSYKTDVVVNGVPGPVVSSDIKTSQKALKPTIVVVGRLVELKGIEQILKALPDLLKRYPQLQLMLIGEGPQREVLCDLVRKLKIDSHVTFTGLVSNVASFLQQATLYVSTSHYEGLPMATLEAMSNGLPVVATDVVGNNDLIVHNENGILYPLNNIEVLQSSIIKVLEESLYAERLSKNARKTVQENYSIAAMVKGYDRIYQMALNGKGSET